MTEYKMESHIKKMTKYIYYNKYTLDKLKKERFLAGLKTKNPNIGY